MSLSAGFNPGGLVNTRVGEQPGSFRSSSGALNATVGTVDLGCQLGSGYNDLTTVQVGRSRKQRNKSKSKSKSSSKSKTSSKSKKTHQRRRHQTRKVRRHCRKEQVGRGVTYAQDLSSSIPNMGSQGAARADIVAVRTD